VSRDVRRFVCHRWMLLEAPAKAEVNLRRVWRERFGYLPPSNDTTVSGFHVQTEDGRAVLLMKPTRATIAATLLSQMLTLIAAKHHTLARLAQPDEVPSARQRTRAGVPASGDVVEQWPADEHRNEAVIAEYATAPGHYLRADASFTDSWQRAATDSLEDAQAFESLSHAEEWLRGEGVLNTFALRYLVGAHAEADQRDAAACDDGMAAP
jgi:hypothetical protein